MCREKSLICCVCFIIALSVVPHLTDAIQEWVERVACTPVARCDEGIPQVCVIEVSCSFIHPII